ncbi:MULTISPECIES: PilZ domain-containing protein [Pseudomonas]|uniref:PilZ domain-containing protein n=2 Tax=Pseudomonas TaxID=286 RepID=A0A9X8QJ93_9PSED|nr:MULTISPECIES: PilZ domain-containing protein [Pseudomonas]SEQ39990.1 PilZ domain-containing protein [Pseudomonas lutea]
MSAPDTSSTQRQHLRVQLPARIRYQGAHREGMEHQLLELSIGGFSFISKSITARTGDNLKGKLLFSINSLSLAIDVTFEIKSVDRDTGRVGCAFYNLAPRELSALQYLIEAYRFNDDVTVSHMIDSAFAQKRLSRGAAGLIKESGTVPLIEGRFEFDEYRLVLPGSSVDFYLFDEQQPRSGIITSLTLEAAGATYVVIATIEPGTQIPAAYTGTPVKIFAASHA